MTELGQILVLATLLAASPVGAWHSQRHPAVRNDTWGGALGFVLSWLGFLLTVAFCAWRARRQARSRGGILSVCSRPAVVHLTDTHDLRSA